MKLDVLLKCKCIFLFFLFQYWFIMKDSNGFRNRKFCLEGPKDLGKPGDVTLRRCNPSSEHQVM